MTSFRQFSCTILLMFFFTSALHAIEFDELHQHIATFEKSGQSRFSPLTMKKLLAYQGATMLAFEHQKSSSIQKEPMTEGNQSAALKNALAQTAGALTEAKNNARVFQQHYTELLQLEHEASKTFTYHHPPQMIPNAVVKKHHNTAKSWMRKAIEATETGQRNDARQFARKAKKAYQLSMDAAMSGLVEQTSRAMSGAAAAGAKRYTPTLWSIASAEFGLLKRYHENQLASIQEKVLIDRPEKPGYAFEMAAYAQKIALQVKGWRRDKGSHEALVLHARQERLDLAKALKLPLDFDEVGVDTDIKALISVIKNMQHTLRQERAQHQAQTTAMDAAFEKILRDDLYKQRIKDQKSFKEKVTHIKRAFRIKLEQETFETKRQSKLRSLFEDDEVDVVSHLNGSLVMRAKNLQFESASSKLDSQYFDLLRRLKEALDMYPDRNITIEGHTDNIGAAKENRQLSLERAEAIQEFLMASDIDAERLRAVGYGEAKPIATNMYKEGRAMNRRIDFIIEAIANE